MSNPRTGRSSAARSRRRALVAAIAVVILVVGAALYFVSSTAPATTSKKTAPTCSPCYSFSFGLFNTEAAIIGQNDYSQVVVLQITHVPEPNNETVSLSGSSLASGVSVGFDPSNETTLTSASTKQNVTVVLQTGPSATVGNDTITISGTAGNYTHSDTFTLRVVEYRVTISRDLFDPAVLNVTAGSTVYWQNLDGPVAYCGTTTPGSGLHNVVFTTIPGANSSTIKQYQVYSYTFTAPGSYYYYSSLDPDNSVNGTIDVLSSSGSIGSAPALPVFSYFKPSQISALPTPAVPGVGVVATHEVGSKGIELPSLGISNDEEVALTGLAVLGSLAVAYMAWASGRASATAAMSQARARERS